MDGIRRAATTVTMFVIVTVLALAMFYVIIIMLDVVWVIQKLSALDAFMAQTQLEDSFRTFVRLCHSFVDGEDDSDENKVTVLLLLLLLVVVLEKKSPWPCSSLQLFSFSCHSSV